MIHTLLGPLNMKCLDIHLDPDGIIRMQRMHVSGSRMFDVEMLVTKLQELR